MVVELGVKGAMIPRAGICHLCMSCVTEILKSYMRDSPVRKCNDRVLCKGMVSRAGGSNSGNYGQTIIDVVQMSMRIIRVVNDQRATESIAILQLVMRVVPIGARLILSVESILKALARLNRTLSNERNAVGPVGSVLEDSVPMLKTESVTRQARSKRRMNSRLSLSSPWWGHADC